MYIGTYRIYGLQDHRQRMSFSPSKDYDFRTGSYARNIKIHIANADETGTNQYSEMTIIGENRESVEKELWAQIDDGIFENYRTGKIINAETHEEMHPNWQIEREAWLNKKDRYGFYEDPYTLYALIDGDESGARSTISPKMNSSGSRT